MLVSIITCSLNNRSTIESSIESILSQTYPNIELIIVDGASVDGTKELINRYEGRVSKFISEKDNGLYHALNKGIGMASGQIIGILHADDFYASRSVIANIVNIFESQDLDSVYGDLDYVDRKNISKIVRRWRAGDYKFNKIGKGWMPPHPALFFKRSIYEKYGLFDDQFKISADYEFILRVLYKNRVSCFYLPQILVKMRTGGKSNINLLAVIRKTYEDLLLMKKYGINFPPLTLLKKNISKIKQFYRKD